MRLQRSIIRFAVLFCFALPTVHAADSSTPTVEVTPLSELAFYPERTAPATVISLNQPVISSQIAARVIEIPVRVGDVVKAGETLAKLDCSDYRLTRQMADGEFKALNARISLAKQRVARALDLESKKLLSTDTLEERQTDLTALRADQVSAKAVLDQARLNSSRCVITSPFQAVVTERLSEVGQYATIGTALIKLVDLEHLEVSAQVFGLDAVRMQSVQSFVLAHDEQRYELKLRNVLRVVDPSTRNREVRLDFAGQPALAGASGKLLWQESRPHLPAEYWVKREGQLGVFILKGGQAHFMVRPNAQMGRANVLDLPLSTSVISKGYQSLANGQRVRMAQ